MSSPSIAAVVPAKGTSTRTPSKNRQELLGVPLFLWAANNLNRVLSKDQIFVDSDSEEIRQLAAAAGFGTIVRPDELATNATDGNGMMRWAASQVDADIVVQHLPPMPFLKESTLRSAIDSVSHRTDSAVGTVEEPLYLWTQEGPTYDRRKVPNSFDLPATIVEGMGLYVAKKEQIEKTGLRYPGTVARIELDRFEAIDIDTPHDLEFARVVAAGLPDDSPYSWGIAQLAQQIGKAA